MSEVTQAIELLREQLLRPMVLRIKELQERVGALEAQVADLPGRDTDTAAGTESAIKGLLDRVVALEVQYSEVMETITAPPKPAEVVVKRKRRTKKAAEEELPFTDEDVANVMQAQRMGHRGCVGIADLTGMDERVVQAVLDAPGDQLHAMELRWLSKRSDVGEGELDA